MTIEEIPPVNTCMDAPMILKDQAKKARPADKQYTIGITFTPSLEAVLLIRKVKPMWQMGKLNFPGGHIEKGESAVDCVIREFKEETNMDIPREQWVVMGRIEGNGYQMMMYTAVLTHEQNAAAKTMTVEELQWYNIRDLQWGVEQRFIISNLPWLTYLALNFLKQGLNGQDKLTFAKITYCD